LNTGPAPVPAAPAKGDDADAPEASPHTSIKAPFELVQDQGRTEDLNAARSGSGAGPARSAGLEEAHWLCPIEDRRRLDSRRERMVERFSSGNDLLLVDFTARLYRKATLSRDLAEILDRPGSTVDHRQARLE
jgi:hypothetical protein